MYRSDGIAYELLRFATARSRRRRSIRYGTQLLAVCCGHLLNRPYSDHDQPAPESRPVVTALLLEPV